MEVAFVLYSVGLCGGNKYIFEIANQLSSRNHKVFFYPNVKPDWMEVNATFLDYLPETDKTIATFWPTANFVFQYGAGEKFYLVQNYDAWFPGQDLVKAESTYKLPLKMIVDCEWLKNYLKLRYGSQIAAVAHGGVEHNLFYPGKPIRAKRILAINRASDLRRDMKTTFEALRLVKEQIPDSEIVMYGQEKLPKLPYEVDYHFKPDYPELAKLYRTSRVFVSSSLLEGCPLCYLESLASGCPLVTTPAGVEDYGINKENMLIVPPKRPKLLAQRIMDILLRDSLYEKLRRNGIKTAANFTWEKTGSIVEAALEGKYWPGHNAIERIVPGCVSEEMYQEHLERYRFASYYVKEKTVLDAGCGVGYGSYHLAKSAASVYGIDISKEAIEYAKKHYRAENLYFSVGNCEQMQFPDNMFDIVVSFEVIEHLRNYINFIKEIKRVLKPNGILILSTPDKNKFLVKDKYHIHEFTYKEFQGLLNAYFRNVIIFYQKSFMIGIAENDELSNYNT